MRIKIYSYKKYAFVFLFICQISFGQTNTTNDNLEQTVTTCNLDIPVNNHDNAVTANITVNSQISSEYEFTPSATVLDVLYVENQGTGQVDFKIMSELNIKRLIVVNTSSGTVKFRAGGSAPYPTITYCELVDTSNSAVFESSVTQTTDSGICAANPDCYPSGTTLAELDITATDTLIWYDALTGGNLLSNTQAIQEGTTYYATNSDGLGCESDRLAVTICIISADDTPFDCDYYAYLFQFNDVYSIDLASGTSLLVAENITDGNINAAGYNNADGYIWGSLSSPSKSIVRIGKNYNTDTYYIPELPSSGRYIGDIDPNGMYYLKPGGTTVYKIDLDPNSSNYLQSAGTITLTTDITIHDWAFNALDGALYTVEKNTNILYKVDISTGLVTSLGEVPILSGNSYTYGAVYFDAAGNFYVSANQTGTIYIIYSAQDLTGSNTISSNFFAFGPASSSNDGARCPTAPVAQEDCSNGIDDDGDGLVDCDDLSCSGVGSCDVNTEASGGNDGGVESNNRLSQKINARNYWRKKSNYRFIKANAKKIVKESSYKKKKSASISLRDFIPIDILSNTLVIESTPTDLLGITNATVVLSVDYLRNSKTIAALLITKTTDGVYEHTKYICDRLMGAEILSISTMYLNEQPFIKTYIKHPNGDKEFVISFSIKETASAFNVDSHWNLDRYDTNSKYFNFQIWSNSIDDVYKLSKEILDLAEVQKPISNYNTSIAPNVFIRKGIYKNGKLSLKIVNKSLQPTVHFVGGLRKTETSTTETVNTSLNLNDTYINELELNTGFIFDVGLRMHAKSTDTPDDIFMSDGAWGVDDTPNSTIVTNFMVSPQTKFAEENEYILERDVSLKATTSEYVSVYKSFTPTFQPIDLSEYNMVNFTASGTGTVEVRFIEKDTPNWEDQYSTEINLTENNQEFSIPFSMLTAHGNQDFLAKNLTTIVFTLKSENQQNQEKEINISSIHFKYGETLSIDDELFSENNKTKVVVAPNPMRQSTKLSFLADTKGSTHIAIYNILGMMVKRTSINTVVGMNVWEFEKENLSSGLYFVKIKSQRLNYKTAKVLIE